MSDDHYLKKELYQRIQNDPKLFDWIEHNSLDGLWYWDLQNQEHKWLSPKFKTIFGYDEEEIPHTSQWWQDNIYQEDLPGVLDNFDKHCADPNHPYDQIVRYRHKTGKCVWIRCRGLVIHDEHGKPIRMIGVHIDVTKEKQREIELERSNRDLSTFAYSACHDLKSPLRGIKQLAQWIEQGLDSIPKDVEEHFTTMKSCITRMERLLSDLLEYSRVGQDQDQDPWEQVNGEILVRDIFDLLAPPEPFKLALHGELPTFETKKTLLEQVLHNLIGNAIKHRSRDDGQVGIWVDEQTHQYRFHVADNGKPIPQQQGQRIFEMFQTLRPKDDVEGSGMGLAISQKIIESLQGEIGLCKKNDKQRPEYSNEFYFTWPKSPNNYTGT